MCYQSVINILGILQAFFIVFFLFLCFFIILVFFTLFYLTSLLLIWCFKIKVFYQILHLNQYVRFTNHIFAFFLLIVSLVCRNLYHLLSQIFFVLCHVSFIINIDATIFKNYNKFRYEINLFIFHLFIRFFQKWIILKSWLDPSYNLRPFLFVIGGSRIIIWINVRFGYQIRIINVNCAVLCPY